MKHTRTENKHKRTGQNSEVELSRSVINIQEDLNELNNLSMVLQENTESNVVSQIIDNFSDEDEEKEQFDSVPVDANTPYNLFFRKLQEMNKLRASYVASNNKYNDLVVFGFEPYFAMAFIKRNMKVTFVIEDLPKLEQPFSINLRGKTNEHVANILRGIIANFEKIKKLVKFGKDIYEKNLVIKANDPVCNNIRFVFNKWKDVRNRLNPTTLITISDLSIKFENYLKKAPTQIMNFKFKEPKEKTSKVYC